MGRAPPRATCATRGAALAAIPWVARLCVALLPLTASATFAAIFDHDDRIVVSADPNSAYAPIGMVWADRLATGFLVDNCHVLTVQHAFGEERSPVGREVVFGVLIVDDQHWTWSWGKVVAAGGLERASDYDSARAADWALLRLRKCLGATVGFASLVATDPGTSAELQSAGYPFDRTWMHGMTLDPACRMRGARGPVWLNDCAALAGNSGSPIFAKQPSDGRLQVYAMQSAAYDLPYPGLPFDNGYANVATPIAEILPHIRRLLKTSVAMGETSSGGR
jgi:V8-like Glu-specific endopeptidase